MGFGEHLRQRVHLGGLKHGAEIDFPIREVIGGASKQAGCCFWLQSGDDRAHGAARPYRHNTRLDGGYYMLIGPVRYNHFAKPAE
jgi:hypothetical protein